MGRMIAGRVRASAQAASGVRAGPGGQARPRPRTYSYAMASRTFNLAARRAGVMAASTPATPAIAT